MNRFSFSTLMPHLRQYPLLLRLVRSVMLIALLIAVVVSGLDLWMMYRRELAQLHENLKNLRVSQVETLTNNLWNFDYEGLAIQLHNIRQYPDILAVVLKEADGKTLRAGEVPLKPGRIIEMRFPLVREYGGKTVSLGEAIFYADTSRLKKQALRQAASSLLAALIALLLTGGCILAVFILHFHRHISKIAEFAEDLELDNLDRRLTLDRKRSPTGVRDELDRIVYALNDMRTRLREGLVRQEKMQRRVELEKVFIDAVINSLPGIFVVYNDEMRPVRWNDLYLEKLALSAEEAGEFRIVERVVPEQRKRFLRAVEEIFTTGHPLQLEIDLLSAEGKQVPYLLTGRVLELEGRKYLISLSTDISERKRMEKELRQGQKMEAVGMLAGGIAHDFNNILSAIIGNLQLAQAAGGDAEKLQTCLTSGLAASRRARDLVERILAIGRRGPRKPIPIRLSTLVEDVVKLLRAGIPSTIEIRKELNSTGCLLADPTELHQVVMNLCTNSYRAMEDEGGVLTIILDEEEVATPRHLEHRMLPVGRYLRLTVTDTGCGMDEETRAMIFEPYFTTRKSGEGTGLGLAVVLGIVRGYDGHILVESEPGSGTTFTLFFPQVDEGDLEGVPPWESMADDRDMSGSERILLVDDERNILDVFSALLTLHGYRVTVFSDSGEALDCVLEDADAWDLVITDMTMPGMTGEILREKIAAVRPDLPVILCTGYSKTINRQQALEKGFAAYLGKPVESPHLLQVVREVLDHPKRKQLRLLLVDDDNYNRQIASLLLQRQGHRVVEAASGEEALEKLATTRFDGVLMDMQMPGLTGPRTTEIIRAAEKGGAGAEEFRRRCGKEPLLLESGHIPVVAMTGNMDEKSRRICLRAGMDGFLSKPFTLESIAAALDVITGMPPVAVSERQDGVREQEDATDNLYEAALSYLKQTYPLEKEQLQKLLAESIRSLREALQAALAAAADRDLPALASAAHRLKGTLLGLGMDGQVAQAKHIEVAAKNGEPLEYEALLERMSNTLQSLLETVPEQKDKKIPNENRTQGD